MSSLSNRNADNTRSVTATAAVTFTYYKELFKALKKIEERAIHIEETQENELINKLLKLSNNETIEEILAI